MEGEESCPMPILGSSSKTTFIFLIACRSFINFEAGKKSDLPPNRVSDIDELCMGCVLRPLSDLSRRFDIGFWERDVFGHLFYLSTNWLGKHRRKGRLRD